MSTAKLNSLRAAEGRLASALNEIVIELIDSQYEGLDRVKAKLFSGPHTEVVETSSVTIEYKAQSNKFDIYDELCHFEAQVSPTVNYTIEENHIRGDASIQYYEQIDHYWTIVAGVREHEQNFEIEVDEHIQIALDQLERIEQLYSEITNQPSLSTLEKLIKRRETNLLTNVLDEERHIDKQRDTELAALFSNGELEVSKTRSYITVTADATDEAFIIGTDDTPVGVFIHTVDGRNLNLRDTSPTDFNVRQAMGYTYDLDDTGSYSDKWDDVRTKTGETTRIQGDLAVTPKTRFTSKKDTIISIILADEFMELIYELSESEPLAFKHDFFSAAELSIDTFGNVSVDLNENIYEVLNDYTRLGTIRNGGSNLGSFETRVDSRGRAEEHAYIDDLEQDVWKHKYEFSADSVLPNPSSIRDQSSIRPLEHMEADIERELRRLEREALPEKRDSSDENPMNKEVEELDEFKSIDGKVSTRLNLPIDNHLLMFEKAMLYPCTKGETAPVTVAIAEESDLTVMHGEHDTKTLTMQPGLYTFDLLQRGLRINERDAHDWWE